MWDNPRLYGSMWINPNNLKTNYLIFGITFIRLELVKKTGLKKFVVHQKYNRLLNSPFFFKLKVYDNRRN